MLKYRTRSGKKEIFDPIRRKWVRCTEEEEVRQQFLLFLLLEKKYPRSHIAVEKEIRVNGLSKRYDIIVFDAQGQPYLVVECKAPQVPIDQSVLEQVALYNQTLHAPVVGVTNGNVHYFFHIDFDTLQITSCDL